MMDYYSNFPGPSEETVIKQFAEKLNLKEPKWKAEICAKMAIDDMGGEESFGSCTGWAVYGEKDFTKRALQHLKDYKAKKRFSIKTLSKIIILFRQMHRCSIERVWAPGGSGFHEAFSHFNSLVL